MKYFFLMKRLIHTNLVRIHFKRKKKEKKKKGSKISLSLYLFTIFKKLRCHPIQYNAHFLEHVANNWDCTSQRQNQDGMSKHISFILEQGYEGILKHAPSIRVIIRQFFFLTNIWSFPQKLKQRERCARGRTLDFSSPNCFKTLESPKDINLVAL